MRLTGLRVWKEKGNGGWTSDPLDTVDVLELGLGRNAAVSQSSDMSITSTVLLGYELQLICVRVSLVVSGKHVNRERPSQTKSV